MEAWRHRRTAYASGRKEVIGFDNDVANPHKRKTQKHKKSQFFSQDSKIKLTPFQGKFHWRVH